VSGGLSRRALVTAATGAPLAAVLGGCLGRSWDELPRTTLNMATGNRGGVFDRYGEALATVLARRIDGLTVETHNTNASLVNLRQVADGSRDIGFTLGDVAADAVRGTGQFPEPLDIAALARTYDSFVHLVVPADSPVEEVADLRGRRVGLGGHGSGTRVIARRVLAVAGVGAREVEATDDALEAASAALSRGDLDAFFFVSGIPNTAVADLARSTAVRLVDMGDLVTNMTGAHGHEYTIGPIPASTYDQPDAVDTLSVKNHVVVRPDLDEDLAYAVTRVVFESQASVEEIAPDVGQPNLGAAIFTSPLPLHPGAERYYRERHL
jgi:TRAP transporter TAXI family solute receptor